MENKVKVQAPRNLDEEDAPLLANTTPCDTAEKTYFHQAISQTCQSTAQVLKLLPTGTVLTFQLLSPIFTNQGECTTVSRGFTIGLIAFCGLSCFLLSFTDSFKDTKGTLCYGFATTRGLWIIDGAHTLPPEVAYKYRLQLIDFVHAFLSILVFAAVALFNQHAVNCFYPNPSDQAKELLQKLPIAIGVVCSIVFVAFPTRRYGIGCPPTTN